MDKKAAQRIRMESSWMFYRLYLNQWRNTNREIDLWDEAHGFGYEDDYTYEEYEEAHKCEEFQKLWDAYMHESDEWRAALHDFCEAMEEFTDGQISRKVAKDMATNPKYAEQIERIMLGKVA